MVWNGAGPSGSGGLENGVRPVVRAGPLWLAQFGGMWGNIQNDHHRRTDVRLGLDTGSIHHGTGLITLQLASRDKLPLGSDE